MKTTRTKIIYTDPRNIRVVDVDKEAAEAEKELEKMIIKLDIHLEEVNKLLYHSLVSKDKKKE